MVVQDLADNGARPGGIGFRAWTRMSEKPGPSFCFGDCPPMRVMISIFETCDASGIDVEPPR